MQEEKFDQWLDFEEEQVEEEEEEEEGGKHAKKVEEQEWMKREKVPHCSLKPFCQNSYRRSNLV